MKNMGENPRGGPCHVASNSGTKIRHSDRWLEKYHPMSSNTTVREPLDCFCTSSEVSQPHKTGTEVGGVRETGGCRSVSGGDLEASGTQGGLHNRGRDGGFPHSRIDVNWSSMIRLFLALDYEKIQGRRRRIQRYNKDQIAARRKTTADVFSERRGDLS